MKKLEKQMIEEEYTSKKPLTILIMIGIVLVWLMAIFAIVFIVNAVVSYIIG